MTSNDLKDLLDSEAARINSPGFISEDPVQFPRRFEDVRDIEIVSLLTSSIAWGNRRMICRDCDRMLALMGHHPYAYMMDEGYEDLDDSGNIHRTFLTVISSIISADCAGFTPDTVHFRSLVVMKI